MSTTAENTVVEASTTSAPVAATQTVATIVAPAKKDGGFSANPTAGELIEFQLTGLLVVFVVLGAVDRIVGGDMHIVQVGGDRETLGDVGEIAVFGRSEQLDLAVTLGFLDGLLGQTPVFT